MIINELSRDDGPKAFIGVKNEDASSISLGHAASHRIGNAASFDGSKVILSVSTANTAAPGFAGIAVADIASGAYGLIQALGAVDSVLVSHEGSSVTVTVGDPLVPGAVAGSMASAAPTYANSGFKYVLCRETGDISGVAYVKGFVRAL